MREKMNAQEKLKYWQKKLESDGDAYEAIAAKFDGREELFRGGHVTRPCVDGDRHRTTYHVRNIVSELIESQVDANIPAPKVTPRRPKDEKLAKIIEDMLRNELDRLPFEALNDIMERTVPIQGGSYLMLEWDNAKGDHDTVGELAVSVLHPKQVVPEQGVYTAVADMDHIIVKLPQTKEAIYRRYGVDVSDEREGEPNIRGRDGEDEASELVTAYVAYYRNDHGGIGRFVWVNDTILEDRDDYQARSLRRCKDCGAPEPSAGEQDDAPAKEGRCPRCGGKFTAQAEDMEEIWLPKVSAHGTIIPGARNEIYNDGDVDEDGAPRLKERLVPTKIPYYRPDIFPIILQKNVSVFGQLLGDSDVDKIADQQNTANRLATKILDKLLKAGSFATLPADAMVRTDNEELKYIRLENVADKAMIDVYDMEGNIDQDLALYRQIYEEARNVIGITDSYQGRRDTTATSGRAKEFSAAQAAGRFESKRVMKNAAYALLFEAMFKFRLAYADEPRTVTGRDDSGDIRYDAFDRYDFLEQDESGEWYWNDAFLFSCDTSASLATNREAMWQETRLNLQQGAFGDPTDVETLILFWDKMARLHYPNAEETKSYLVEKRQRKAAEAAASLPGHDERFPRPTVGNEDIRTAENRERR